MEPVSTLSKTPKCYVCGCSLGKSPKEMLRQVIINNVAENCYTGHSALTI